MPRLRPSAGPRAICPRSRAVAPLLAAAAAAAGAAAATAAPRCATGLATALLFRRSAAPAARGGRRPPGPHGGQPTGLAPRAHAAVPGVRLAAEPLAAARSGRLRARPVAAAAAGGPEEAPELDVEGPLEDDWQMEPAFGQLADSASTPGVEAHPGTGLGSDTLREKYGVSEAEARLWERGVDAMMEDGKFPEDIRQELTQYASNESVLDSFDGIAGQNKWVSVQLNDTWTLSVAQVGGGAAKLVNIMRTETEVTDEVRDFFAEGDSIFPGAIILARWLAIHPPLVDLQGKVVVELGAGVGLPGVLAACLGAARVLLQDRSDEPLQEVMQTAVENGVADRVTTLRCDWQGLPTRLLSASEEVLQGHTEADVFLGSDILFDEGAASAIADVLAQLLRSPTQVAHIADPYKRRHRRAFVRRCRSSGLEVTESEIVTWEPEHDNGMENDDEWVCTLITVRRM